MVGAIFQVLKRAFLLSPGSTEAFPGGWPGYWCSSYSSSIFHVSEIDLFVFIDMLDTSKPASYSCSSSDRWALSWKKSLQVK
jgi:hypothetical protein